MIGVTERAKAELKKLLVNNVDNPQARLRLKVNAQKKLGVGIDIEMPGDKTIKYKGSTLIVIEQELADSLHDMYIDVEDTKQGRELVLVDKSS
jgi:Fe-S cluster assembly iron-binding protein IscA